jgi:enterochelin esterase-like enzyme
MPKSRVPRHLEIAPENLQGQLDSLSFESAVFEDTRNVKVYLPVDYSKTDNRYPVIYVNYGEMAIQAAKMTNSLDNLIGKTVKPVIAVFIPAVSSFQEYSREKRDQYAQMVAEELVPQIDAKYRTINNPDARAFMGADEGGYSAFYTTFKYPDTFSKIAGQSTHFMPTENPALKQLISGSEKRPFTIYLDWGKYDIVYDSGFNWRLLNQELAGFLKQNGYSYTGGEVNCGFNWACWRNRTDKILETFFPLQ